MNNKKMIQAKWQGLKGFLQWVKDFEPRILNKNKRYEIWKPTKDQLVYIAHTFIKDTQLALNIQPRRHGKSTANMMLVLWKITSSVNTTIQLLGCTEDHGRRVMMQPLKNIINHTPKLSKIIPHGNEFQKNFLISLPHLGNKVQLATGSLGLGAFGDKIDVLWISDFHNMIDLTAFEAFQGSLLDQEDTLVLIDSNVDPLGGHVHSLQEAAEKDKSIFCQSVSYPDLETYLKKAPEWINRQSAISLAKHNPLSMKRDLLGQRSNAANSLFSAKIIKAAQNDYQLPVNDIESITKGRKYKIGGGLDRAKKLIAGSRGDHTVWTVILKVAVAGDEAEYYILNQVTLKINTDKALKKLIIDDHKKYGLDSCYLEDFHISDDIQNYLTKMNVPFKIVSPTTQNQNVAFPEMYRIFSENRFHYPKTLTSFTNELSMFMVKENKNKSYAFGHPDSKKLHDDTVYSVAWCLYGLSKFQLDLYELPLIQCSVKNPQRGMCFLLGGDFSLTCRVRCAAFQKVHDMYIQHVRISMDDDIEVEEFYKKYVRWLKYYFINLAFLID